ncbi:MAG TPA: acyl-CoA dehydrogenase family protein [Polyangiaceae bacterium]|nr:acyl-CoA dehydrogenase family protein [Polyangiaceae bacterium]
MSPDESFAKALYFGDVAENLVFPWPEPAQAEIDLVHALTASLRRYAAKHVDSAAMDRDEEIPAEVLRGLGELGLFGMLVPKKYGGAGLSQTAYARVIQELAGIDASLGVTVGAHSSLGTMGLVLFGTEQQRATYLPRLVSGDTLAAFALTEPGAGSDASAIQTSAVRDGDSYVLNGTKIWTSNGGVADLFTVFARTSPAEYGAKPRLTAFLVERGPGVTSGKNEKKLGIRGSSTTSVTLDDVRVHESAVLGEVGRGFKVAMEILNRGRLSLASGCVGASKRLLRLAVERAEERKAFGRPIGGFGLIKDKIARMVAETFALESMTYLTTGIVDARPGDHSVESAVCKVFGSETLDRVANEALQIAAGAGYMQSYPYERIYRDARINLIFEGTNEILRCFIALSGMQGPGRELSEVAKAVREPIKGFGLLSEFAMRKARSALSRERLSHIHPELEAEGDVLGEYATLLAKHADRTIRRHGRMVHEMQFPQKRAADMTIDLYAIAAVLSRTSRALERRGLEGSKRELDMTRMFVASARRRLAACVAELEENDDELRKSIAERAYVDGGYPFDVM